MRYFITGATGFIGGRLAHHLIAAGHEVVALVRSPEKAGGLAAVGVELARGDITDRATLRVPMTGVDGVFHVAGWYQVGTKDKAAGARINIDGTRNVLETMHDLGIPKGVYTSTLAIYSDTRGREVTEDYRYIGPYLNEYERTKAAAHYEVAHPLIEAGLPLVIVQPGTVYGPGDTSAIREVMVQYLRGRLPMLPQGMTFAWAHIDDVARAQVLAMEAGRPGESYHINGPVHTIVEAFQMAEAITGIPAPKLHVPPAALRLGAALVRFIEPWVDLPPNYTAEGLRASAGVTYIASNAKARRELSYNPRPLAEGLRETLEHELGLLEIQPPGSR